MKRFVVIGALIVLGASAFFLLNNRRGGVPAEMIERLQAVRVALDATESLDTQAADPTWEMLRTQMPGDRSIALNRAINRLLAIDALVDTTNNAVLGAEDKMAARQQLPAAIQQARQAVGDFGPLDPESTLTTWANSRIDLQEASLLPASISKSIRREVFNRLAKVVSGDPGTAAETMILGGLLTRVLEEMETPAGGLPGELREPAATSLADFSQRHPDNLFIALRSAQVSIDAKSDRAAVAVRRTLELARAIEPTLRVQTMSIGMTPDDLVQKIVTAIESQDWQTAENQMLLWFNVLNSTDLVKTDRRRVSPHPLDLISFDVLRQLSAPVVRANPVREASSEPIFEKSTVDDSVDYEFAIPMDVDLDLRPDAVAFTATGGVRVFRNVDDQNWTAFGDLELGLPVHGAFAADLFMVDASDSARLQVNPVDGAGGATSSRHNMLLTMLAYGDDGVRLVAVDGRPETSNDRRVTLVEKPSGLEDLRNVTAATTGDFDGDGDLDIMFATTDLGIQVFINRGNRTFFKADQSTDDSLSKSTGIVAMRIADLDRDLDLDVITIDGQTGQVGMVENLLHLQFRARPLASIPAAVGANRIDVADLDGNVSWDLVISGEGPTRIVFSQTADANAWSVDSIKDVGRAEKVVAIEDFDNDSLTEILAVDASNARMARIVGDGIAFRPVENGNYPQQAAAVADFNRDGKLDLLAVEDGQLCWFVNQTPTDAHHIEIRFRGIDDNNANSGRVNHYAIGSVLELRFGPHYREKIITSPVTHFGTDGIDTVSSIRVIFPNGLTQTIREPKIDLLVEEEQTLKGSCPYLYAWDGERFGFVTDCLWAAPLGLQVAAGVVAKDRPWEYLKVDGDRLKSKDGHYEIRITEELWEIAYMDHVALTAVDHPEGTQIWTNEKVGPAEVAKPVIHAFDDTDKRTPVTAVDTRGRDVTEKIGSIDRDFVQGFDRRLRQGLCPPHWVDLDFGDLTQAVQDGRSLYLVLTGWILPTDTSLNIQIDQNPELPSIEFPSVWVPDASEDDGWRNAIPFMGFPGGKTKTIVVDVTKIINVDDPRFRICTSAQIYWDAASLVVQQSTPEVITHDLVLANAELTYHGFSKRIRESALSPETCVYDDVTMEPSWPPLRGPLTMFGPCRPLVDAWDDRMVVMSGGDELRLRFVVPDSGPPKGWKRDFILHSVGWDKDADLNTLAGQSSLPLPFKQMREYPPTVSQQTEIDAVDELNQPHLQRSQSFRQFWHRGVGVTSANSL